MNTIYVAISCVDSSGFNSIPVGKEFIHGSTMQAQYSNRKLFGGDKEVLLIEQVKTAENKAWMYYQYMLWGIFDASQRAESIFGLTVVTDTLCSDANLMLDLCRKAFNKYVVGKILQPKGGTYQVRGILSSQESVRKEVEDFLAKMLVTYQNFGLLEESVVSVSALPYQPVSTNNDKQVLCRLHPDDANPPKIIELIKAGKKVAVSGNYPALLQQRIVDEKIRIERELNVCKNELADTKLSLSNANKQVSDARLENNKLQNEIAELREGSNRNSQKMKETLERKKKEYEAEISKYKAQGNYPMQKQLDEIKALIQSQSQEQVSPHIGTNKNKRRRGITKSMIFALTFAVLVVFVLLFVVKQCTGDGKDKAGYFSDNSSEASSIQNIQEVPIVPPDKSDIFKEGGKVRRPLNPNAKQQDNVGINNNDEEITGTVKYEQEDTDTDDSGTGDEG